VLAIAPAAAGVTASVEESSRPDRGKDPRRRLAADVLGFGLGSVASPEPWGVSCEVALFFLLLRVGRCEKRSSCDSRAWTGGAEAVRRVS